MRCHSERHAAFHIADETKRPEVLHEPVRLVQFCCVQNAVRHAAVHERRHPPERMIEVVEPVQSHSTGAQHAGAVNWNGDREHRVIVQPRIVKREPQVAIWIAGVDFPHVRHVRQGRSCEKHRLAHIQSDVVVEYVSDARISDAELSLVALYAADLFEHCQSAFLVRYVVLAAVLGPQPHRTHCESDYYETRENPRLSRKETRVHGAPFPLTALGTANLSKNLRRGRPPVAASPADALSHSPRAGCDGQYPRDVQGSCFDPYPSVVYLTDDRCSDRSHARVP